MAARKIGVMVESFRLGLRPGIEKAAAIGADGVQIYATGGEMDADKLDSAARAELKSFIEDKGLVISALCADLGGHGFERADDNDWKVPKSKQIMDLAVELGTDVVTTHIGVVPDEPNDMYKTMQDACNALAEHGDKVGATFAIETGPEPAAVLKGFLDSLGAKGLRVNFDPANLAMVIGEDPVESVKTLGEYVVHTHAKDGKMVKKEDPRVVYGWFAGGGIEDLRLSDYFIETPLGEGAVDFPAYIAALDGMGYDGFLTIEREVGDDPVADIEKAIGFLRAL